MDKQSGYFLVGIVFGIFGAAFAVGNKMTAYYCEAGSIFLGQNLSNWPYCEPWVVFVHIALFSSGSLLALLIFNYLVAKLKLAIERISGQIKRKRLEIEERKKVMTLTADPFQENSNRLDLRIHNNEKMDIVIHDMFVGHVAGQRIRVSDIIVPVSAGKSQSASFITLIKREGRFSIINHFSDGTRRDEFFGPDEHSFLAEIVYESKEKKQKGLIERFQVKLKYEVDKTPEVTSISRV